MKIVLADERISDKCRRGLELRGFFPILLPPHPALPEPICSHPDSLIFYTRRELFTPAEYCERAAYVFSDIREYAPDIKIHFTSDILGSKYPEDARMNAKPLGDKLLLNKRTVSDAILSFAGEKGLDIVNTRQGYPACTALSLDGLVITADEGIKRALRDTNIKTAMIDYGGISLPPYDTGFIGGASGVYKDQVFFLGDCKTHPSCDIIERELKAYGYSPISLSDEPLSDLGGLIFLD